MCLKTKVKKTINKYETCMTLFCTNAINHVLSIRTIVSHGLLHFGACIFGLLQEFLISLMELFHRDAALLL